MAAAKTRLHKGSIPGTEIGHHWFAVHGIKYGVFGWPHGRNKGWAYEICDDQGHVIDDSCFTLHEVRVWADGEYVDHLPEVRRAMTPATVRRVPNAPKTPLHSFRCPDELWSAAKAAATANDEVLAEVLRKYLERYVRSRAKRG